MIRGEYILEDGTIIPNQFTVLGMQAVVKAAFWNERRPWYMGYCAKNPGSLISMDSLLEPTIGVNGYQRQILTPDKPGWGKMGTINGETWIESRVVEFPATGPYDQEVNRLFLTDGDNVLSISSAFPGGLQTISTPTQRRYRLFFR